MTSEPRGKTSNDHFIDVGGVKTHYLEAGEGETLILVHGGLAMECAEINYGPVLPLLSEQFHVIAPDVVGSGLTPIRSARDYSNEAQAEFLLDFIDELGFGEVSLAGNSNGGWLVQYVAHERPSQVTRLVIINSLNGTGAIPPLPVGERYLYGPKGRSHQYPTIESTTAYLKEFYLRSSSVTEARIRRVYEISVRNHENAKARDMAINSSREDANRNLSYRGKFMFEWADRLTIPVLLTWSRENQGSTPKDAIDFLSRLGCGELHVFIGAGHHVQVDQRERWTDVVTDFLQNNPRGHAPSSSASRAAP